MIDNSKNQFNVEYNIKNKQLIEANHVQNELKIENYEFKIMMEEKERKRKTIELLNKPTFTLNDEDKNYIAHSFNLILKPKKKQFDKYNYYKASHIFLEKNSDMKIEYNNDKYSDKINQIVDIVKNKNDPLTLAMYGYNFYKNYN